MNHTLPPTCSLCPQPATLQIINPAGDSQFVCEDHFPPDCLAFRPLCSGPHHHTQATWEQTLQAAHNPLQQLGVTPEPLTIPKLDELIKPLLNSLIDTKPDNPT